MRRIVTFLIAVLIMMTVNAQTLTERQKGLAACACLMAQGDLERLEPAVKTALDNGATINELKEAFSQLYAYTGFPRSLNALGVLNKVLENKQASWQEGKPWTRPAEWDDAKAAYELGKKNQPSARRSCQARRSGSCSSGGKMWWWHDRPGMSGQRKASCDSRRNVR